VTGINAVGEIITLKYKLKNLSTRVTTVERLNALDENFAPLTNDGGPIEFGELIEEYTESYTLRLTLESAIEKGENLTIYVGNDYVGYYPIIIEKAAFGERTTPVDLIGILFAAPILLLMKKRKS
jgi:hypothetical protein